LLYTTVSGNECSDALAQADADNSNDLTKEEFTNFVSIYLPNCYDPSSELTGFQEAVYKTLACTCLVTSFDLECCSEENAVVQIDSLPDAICVAVSGASLTDGCSFEDIPGVGDKGEDGQQEGDNDGTENDFLADIIDSECADTLRSQDLNNDRLLTLDEYGAYLAARFPDCYESSVPSDLQKRLFTGLACGYCATNPPNDLSCCSNITDETALVGIEDGVGLASVCSAAIAGKQLDCIDPPIQEEQILTKECVEALVQADADGSETLVRSELGSFLKIRYPECSAYEDGELSQAQEFVLKGIACANCATIPPFSLTCCNDEEYFVSIAGVNNENRTLLQTANLATICSSVDATAAIDGCLPFGDGDGGDGNENPTPEPVSQPSVAPSTLTPSAENDLLTTLQPTGLREETRRPSSIGAEPAGINSPNDDGVGFSGVSVETTVLSVVAMILAALLL
jgi:hypothetical protein